MRKGAGGGGRGAAGGVRRRCFVKKSKKLPNSKIGSTEIIISKNSQ